MGNKLKEDPCGRIIYSLGPPRELDLRSLGQGYTEIQEIVRKKTTGVGD